jgi:acyl-CoA dehydrogenase
MSEKVRPLYDHVKKFIRETVEPMSVEFYRLGEKKTGPLELYARPARVLEKAKDKAKEVGLWNFFLPDAETGEGLKNLDYAYIAAELGKSPLASETMNCSAPDTGNMEVLERVGTKEQKEKWLKPLLNGEIRSAYAMTEPNVASSDAKNISTTRKARRRRVGDQRREVLHLRRRRSRAARS